VRAVQRLYASRADAVIVPSAYLARLVVAWGVDPARLRVIYNGVQSPSPGPSPAEVRARLGVPTEVALIVTAARLTPWKRVDALVRSLASLLTSGRCARLAVLGDGEEAGRLLELSRALGVTGAVRFVGAVPQTEVAGYLRAADVFALPSSYEGFSHVLLEAMVAGAPVVAAAVGGNPELIVSGDNGLLIPPGDDHALTEALARLVDEPDLRERLRDGARHTLQGFQWERSYRQTLTVLEAAAGQGSGSS
jgi:glycosyltransferase involved in cell wall biosynthesis